MKKVLVGLAFVTVSLFATDVSQMKILGIGLGDKYEDIKKKLPCQDKRKTFNFMDVLGFDIRCDKANEGLQSFFDDKNKLYAITRKIEFNTEADIQIIFDDVVKKYGNPDISGVKNESFYIKSFCYGECYLSSDNVAYEKDGYGQSLRIFFEKTENSNGNLYFVLRDNDKSKKYDEYLKKEVKKHKQESSKIQF